MNDKYQISYCNNYLALYRTYFVNMLQVFKCYLAHLYFSTLVFDTGMGKQGTDI